MNRLPKKSDNKMDYEQYYQQAKTVHKLNNINFDPTVFYVYNDATGIFVSLQSSNDVATYPTDFGIRSINANVISIYGGSIIIGDAETEVQDTNITITEEVNIIGTEYSYAGGTFTIKNFGAAFTTDTMHIRKKLFTVSYIDSTLSIVRVHNPQIYPANWGNQDA